MEVQAKKIKENLIVDPSFFGYKESTISILESKLLEEHRIVVPTYLYEAVRLRNYERFAETLSFWEGKQDEQYRQVELREVWSTILDLSDRITKNFMPGTEILKQLPPAKREEALTIEKILSTPEPYRTPRLEMPTFQIAKEMLVLASVTSPIISVSDKAKNWYNKLGGAVVKKVEKNSTMMRGKKQYRDKVEAAGWTGKVFIWLAKHMPIPYSGDIIDLIVVVFANGTYKCQFCARSLWRFPKDISYCPYCSNKLPP